MNWVGRAIVVGFSIREHPDRVQPSLPFDDRPRHVVEHHQSFVAIFDPGILMPSTEVSRYEKHAGLELWHRYFPVPTKFYDFLLARAAVDLVL
jgi:hypothetical protein